MRQAKQYFECHDAVNTLFFTSDDLAFFDEQNAINHAAQLEDKTITTKTREQVDRETDAIATGTLEDLEYDPLDEPDAE